MLMHVQEVYDHKIEVLKFDMIRVKYTIAFNRIMQIKLKTLVHLIIGLHEPK
jgi:hypothetical protein